jgi:hypothetical protein
MSNNLSAKVDRSRQKINLEVPKRGRVPRTARGPAPRHGRRHGRRRVRDGVLTDVPGGAAERV